MKWGEAILLLGFSTLALSSCTGQEQPVAKSDTRFSEQESFLSQGYVCMVDNSLKDSLLIPVAFNGLTYYGCCAPCVEVLEGDTTFRYATDPVSGKIISKATALMALKSGSESEVEYFESESTLKQQQSKTTK